jgi:ribonuclease VapC
MTLDSSAVVAILFAEPGYMDLIDRILEAEVVRIGAPTLVEASFVVAARRRKPDAPEVEELMRELGVAVSSFGEAEWRAAMQAFASYGRGRHKANLNFGDCLAYAAARASRDTLLFVGKNFRLTDISPAIQL